MRGKKVKELRKYIRNNLTAVLIVIRNAVGDRTNTMDKRNIYQNSKKLYISGKLKLN